MPSTTPGIGIDGHCLHIEHEGENIRGQNRSKNSTGQNHKIVTLDQICN